MKNLLYPHLVKYNLIDENFYNLNSNLKKMDFSYIQNFDFFKSIKIGILIHQ